MIKTTEKNRDAALEEVLKELNIPPHLDGYHYLKEAVNKVVEDKKTLKDMMDAVYARIAEENHASPVSVERTMRYAAYVAWMKSAPEVKKEIFGGIAESPKRPANKYFIAAIAEYIKSAA